MPILKNKKRRRGFTLIEMVIVITIIGILSSIAVTKYSKVQENAKKNADYATAANLATAAMISISDGNTSVQPSDLKNDEYIQFVPVAKSVKDGSFVVTAQGDSVTVKIGTETFYPKPEETVNTPSGS
ncbi:type II secretion system protein [Terrisporobacter vanillatitrophus]|uniref:type II secretion system protein n=1 Tax=Terrisporobacter vanillatitrophus TaxID=3058402 RepID=UPI003367E84D